MSSRPSASWRAHLRSFVLPLTAAGLVPWALLGDPAPTREPASAPAVAAGVVVAACGLALLAWTVSLFVRIGRGTLAPWDPTRRLVVEGPYRRVRNPMITGVLAILVGEAIAFGAPRLWLWAATFLAINHAWFLAVEEPGLRKRFGPEYDAYRSAVPRWIPRVTPWRPEDPGIQK